MELKNNNVNGDILTGVVKKISLCRTESELISVIATAARELCNADGATFVLKEDNNCYYIEENAISPLWKGKKFPLESCVSGIAMTQKEVVCLIEYCTPALDNVAYP